MEHQKTNPRASAVQGFTLIELVMVIVILGVLAATSLPKFLDLGKDARVAALSGMKGAIASASAMANAKCAVSGSTCGVDWEWTHNPVPRIVIGNATHQMHLGYPDSGNWDPAGGIGAMVNRSGFSVVLEGSFVAHFRKDGAPDPANCKVTYTEPTVAGVFPSVDITATGC